MSQIVELNRLMPTDLDKTSQEYQAIFGKEDFTPLDPIVQSSDFQCGGIANELEYVKGFVDYITRTSGFEDFEGVYLEKMVYWFTGLERWYLETDAQLRCRFYALVRRQMNPSWITTWMIRDVFKYFYDEEIIYVTENYVLDEFVVDGSFETDPTTNWPVHEEGTSTVDFVEHDMFYGVMCAEFSVDASGSDCYMYQTLPSVPTGHYVLSFFTKDDRALPTSDLFKVTIRRSGDDYYYNFATLAWQAAEVHWTISKNSGTRYESQQAFVDVPSSPGMVNLTVRFENIGGTSMPYSFYIDKVNFGTMLAYPTVKLVLVDKNLATGFMSSWPGTADPVAGGADYTAASYFEQCYASGFGGEGMLPYYQHLFSIVKPTGVNSMVEVVWRGHE